MITPTDSGSSDTHPTAMAPVLAAFARGDHLAARRALRAAEGGRLSHADREAAARLRRALATDWTYVAMAVGLGALWWGLWAVSTG